MSMQNFMSHLVIGVDFGTDSVRALLVDTKNGKEVRRAICEYPRWKKGFYCDAEKSMFRQHPLDYIESLERCLLNLLDGVDEEIKLNVKGISIATTGSTPVAVNEKGMPLALTAGFEDEPDGMFILWKDHTAIKEAKEINELSWRWEEDYTKYSGGLYSSEWFWSKILYTFRANEEVMKNTSSWVELSDWIPALLTGCKHYTDIKRNRCAAGHKAMWHEKFEGLPSEKFLVKLDRRLAGLRDRLYKDTYTSDKAAGKLSGDWALKLGLLPSVMVGIGGVDAHFGAVGANIKPYHLVKVVGTSTCDMVVLPRDIRNGRLVKGICGQVQGSILPNMLGLEAGQSAFGDLFDWFAGLLIYGAEFFGSGYNKREIKSDLLKKLNGEAEQLPVDINDLVILDWINGRRTPDVDLSLNSWVMGINLSTDAPKVFKALVEAAAYGSRSIVERLENEGVHIHEVIATGGISKKSPFVMQTLANVLDRSIKVVKSDQSGAMGAAMFASVACGIHKNIFEAQKKMFTGIEQEYLPKDGYVKVYDKLYEKYKYLGRAQEKSK